MTPSPEAQARGKRVIARALAKPVSDLPYRAPIKTRWSFNPRINSANLALNSQPTRENSASLTHRRTMRPRLGGGRLAAARRQERASPASSTGLLEHHQLASGRWVTLPNDSHLTHQR